MSIEPTKMASAHKGENRAKSRKNVNHRESTTTHLVIAESMYTNFSPSVPSSLGGTDERKLRRSLFFSNG